MELRGKKERRYKRTHKRGRRAESDCPSISLMPENGEIFGNASLGQGSRNEWMLDRDGRDGRSAFVMGSPGKKK